jgi:hypothetical protein
VIAHPAHPLAVADARCGALHSGEIVRRECGEDFLNRGEVIAHVRALVLRHMREERQWLSRVAAGRWSMRCG